MMRPHSRELQTWLALTLFCIAIYVVWPELDRWVAAWFFDQPTGFVATGWPWVKTWHAAVPWTGRAMVIGSIGLLVFGSRKLSPATRRQLASLAVALIVGLWLILHVGFKDQWGRPRPADITQFGGAETYSSPLIPSSACHSNCSFMSGHAGTGFVLMAWGALAMTRKRRRWLIIGWAAGMTLGLIRMAQGGHFLGDVVFGGLLLWACAWITRWVYVRRRAVRLSKRRT